jgi:Family of unknown function (DUF5946)
VLNEQKQYHELTFYTLAHSDPTFIHQNVVDAFAAQTATEADKPIKIAFALVGLYLSVAKGRTGREVQSAHMRLARHRKNWPRFSPPADRGIIRVGDVIAAAPGAERDAMITQWCESVWAAWGHVHGQIAALCEKELGVSRG